MRQDNLLNGMILGAGLMYLLDPNRGARRRAKLRDKGVHFVHKTGDAAETTARDLGNRSRGVVAEGRARLRREETVPDPVLEARVRSGLGRLVSHPGAIEVRAQAGVVTLGGPVLADEVEQLVEGVSRVRGVEGVERRLEVHESAGDVPGLQGQGSRPAPRFELLQENWSPAARLMMGTLGGAVALRGMRGDGPVDTALALVGLGVLSRAATNLPTRRLVGVGAGRHAVDIHKTVNVAAPVEEVFAFWSNYENFPRFMSHLTEVRLTGEGRSHWVAKGPAGVPIAWEAETTAYEVNRAIAWKSVGDAPVGNAGIVRFQPTTQGGTRLDIHLSYNPPVGALGHALAAFLGVDPKHALDDDMVRLKSLLERGRTSAHGKTVAADEVAAART